MFEPSSVKYLKPHDKRNDQEAIMIPKQNFTIKKLIVSMAFNGKPTRECLSRGDTASPMASLVGIDLTEKIG